MATMKLLILLSLLLLSQGFSPLKNAASTRKSHIPVFRFTPKSTASPRKSQSSRTTTTTTKTATSLHASGSDNAAAPLIALAQTLAPQVGVITSTALYLAPIVSVWKAIESNDIGDLNPLPVAIMSIVSVSWLAFGLASQDIYVALSNIGGAIVSIGYVVGMLPLLNNDKRSLRQVQAVLMTGVAAVLSLWTYLGVSRAPLHKMSTALGLFASSLFVILSGSPLSTIKTVIARRNSGSILGSLTAAQVTNTFLWSAYGLAIRDRFVWGPNVVGFGLGLIQLFLKLIFPEGQK